MITPQSPFSVGLQHDIGAFTGAQREQIQGTRENHSWYEHKPYRPTDLVIRTIHILEEFVSAGDFLVYKFPVWSWYCPTTTPCTTTYQCEQGEGRCCQGKRLSSGRQAISSYSRRCESMLTSSQPYHHTLVH